jgi:hypothetical protein
MGTASFEERDAEVEAEVCEGPAAVTTGTTLGDGVEVEVTVTTEATPL